MRSDDVLPTTRDRISNPHLYLCCTSQPCSRQLRNSGVRFRPGRSAHTMVELHSNFTIDGSKTIVDGVYPTNHAEHETVEITHGFNDWFECGFYIFTSITEGQRWQWVGDHIRPRVAIPKKWNWPVGVSLSNEIGYQRRQYSVDTWTWEIRPIVDQKAGRWYWSLNPTLDRSFHGESVNQGVVFSPNFKFSYDFTPKVAGGLEYYGSSAR